MQQKIDTSNQISSIFSELKNLSTDEKTEWVSVHKLIGNKYYRSGNYNKAQEVYFETITAAKILKDEDTVIVVLCNLSMCLISQNNYSGAITMAEKVLKIRPNHSGALEKRARAHFAMGRVQEAENDLNQAIQYCEDKKICAKLNEFKDKVRQAKVKTDKLYKKMVEKPKANRIELPAWVLRLTKVLVGPISWISSTRFCKKRKQKNS